MKKDSNLDVGRVDWCDRMNHVVRPMVECGLALWLLMLAAGCQTQFPQPSGAKDQTTAPSQTFALREGDRLKISFPGSPTLDTEQLIRRDGKITLPLVGEVQAAGMSTEALRQNLINLYAPQLSSKEVNVA
ncbi:MAG: polysaccharide biosynthesis/export family protein, partial [Verrucomicrobiota bacterium]